MHATLPYYLRYLLNMYLRMTLGDGEMQRGGASSCRPVDTVSPIRKPDFSSLEGKETDGLGASRSAPNGALRCAAACA